MSVVNTPLSQGFGLDEVFTTELLILTILVFIAVAIGAIRLIIGE